MATKPQHPKPEPPKPAPPPAPEPEDPAAAATSPKAPPPVMTIADEQRARSAEIQAMGVEKWKEAHDQRSPEERQPRQVPGVKPRVNDAGGGVSQNPRPGSWEGSTRSTPEARRAQNVAAPS